MRYNKKEILKANEDSETKETMIKLYEEEENLKENCEMILKYFEKINNQ